MLTRIICLEDIEDIDFKAFDQQLYRQKWSGYKNSFKFLNTNDVSKLTLFGATNNIQEFRRNHSNCKLSHNENSAYYIKTETEQRNRTLREKCPYLELFWSVFFRIRTEYGEVLRIFPYSIQMWKNKGRHNSEYGHFLRGGRSKLQYSRILSMYRNILNR